MSGRRIGVYICHCGGNISDHVDVQKLAENIINWVSHDDTFIDIPVTEAPDKELVLSQSTGIMLATLFLILLPIALLAAGIRIWLQRRKQ